MSQAPQAFKSASLSVNFKLTTNERYIQEQEKTRPLDPSDSDLIRSSFKPEYVKPMLTYALISKDSKRRKLYSFLRGENPPSTSTIGRSRIFQPTKRENDLVIQSARGSIDFNRSIFGDPRCKKMDPHKFESRGIRGDGIFGFTKQLEPSQQEHAYLDLFIAKKLMTPQAVARIEDTVEDQHQILNEILQWCEKRANYNPINPIPTDSPFYPTNEMLITKAKMEEDHMYSTNHTFYKPHAQARSLRATPKFKTNYVTCYMDSFCDEIHNNLPTSVQPSYKPLGNNKPFAVFPDLGPIEWAKNPVIEQQSRENKSMARLNYQVFNSKTCL